MDFFKGVDISVVQGHMDFDALKKLGYDFVICRAGVGNDAPDTHCLDNLNRAALSGLKTAVYHFVYPLPTVVGKSGHDPVEQANLHYNFITDKVSLVIVDLEWPAVTDWHKWGCSTQQIKDWTKAYLVEYERLSGNKPMIYSYPSFIQALDMDDSFAEYDYWTASYTTNPVCPKPFTDWKIWQTTGSGHLLGVEIDLDFCKDLSIFGQDAPSDPTATDTQTNQ